jgi:type VI secretion system protein ImpK
MAHDDPYAPGPDENRTVLRPMPGGTRLGAPPPTPPPGPAAAPPRATAQEPAWSTAGLPPLPGPRDGVNPLESAAGTLLALTSRLRSAPSHPDPDRLRSQLVAEIKAFEERARAAGVPADTVLRARYALCTVLDEAVLNTPWGAASVWRTHSLLTTFHNDTWGGEKFFVLLKEAAQDPATHLHLLELMHVCLSLGFQGRYRVLDRGQQQVEELRERLYQIIRTQRGQYERELSPHWTGVTDRRNALMHFVPLWVVGAVAAILLVGLFVALSFALNAASDPVFSQLHGVRAKARPIEVKAPPPVQVVVVPAPAPPKAAPPPPARRMPRLRELLAPEIRQRLVELEESPDRVTVIVLGDTLFRSGSGKLEPGYVDLFRRIGEALDEVPGRILVTGHTDNVPVRSLRFPSNWHLSQERALSVMQVVSARVQAKGRLEAEGRADTEPRAPNDTPANRARNRRVEVNLLLPAGDK